MLQVCKGTFFARGYKVKGGSVLDSEHPLVKAHPEHFQPIEETRIAEATATPPRSTRVRKAKAAGKDADSETDVNNELTRPNNGASKRDWTAYAESLGLEVPPDMKRDAIIELVDEQGQVAY